MAYHYDRRHVLTKKATINDAHTLGQLIEMEIESAGGRGQGGEVTHTIRQKAKAFDDAVEKTLLAWVKKHQDELEMGEGPLQHATDPEAVVSVMMELRGGAGYLYYMEHEGHGVGTWDGDWDPMFVDPRHTIKELSTHVKKETLRQYNDLHEAISEEAYKWVPEEE